MIRIIVEGPPVPLARARHGDGPRPTNEKRSLEYRSRVIRATRSQMKSEFGLVNAPLFQKGSWLYASFVFVGPRVRNADVDNMLKNGMDGITSAGLWRDDKQVECAPAVRVPSIQGEWTAISVREMDSHELELVARSAMTTIETMRPALATFAKFSWQEKKR